MNKENKALKEESQTQKLEIATLKSELKKAGAATRTEEQLDSNGDGTRAEANSQGVKSEIKEAEKLVERCDEIISPTFCNEASDESANSPLAKTLWRLRE